MTITQLKLFNCDQKIIRNCITRFQALTVEINDLFGLNPKAVKRQAESHIFFFEILMDFKSKFTV